MATFTPFVTSSEVDGTYYPQDYYLNTFNFVGAAKQKYDLKKLVSELNYYEDIYSFVTSGYATLTDAQGFIEVLQLTGNEYVEIDFGKSKSAPNGVNVVKTFRVYKIGNRTPSGNQNAEFFTIYFCSEELLLSEQTKISKSYTGQKISDNITDILTEKLRISSEKIEVIEETTGINDFVVPKLKPFEAISWLSNYARPQSTGTVGADMLFFETKNGYNFRSLQSMYKDDVYATYKYQAKNIDRPKSNAQENSITVLEYEIIKSFDMMNEISSGSLANRLITIDPLTRTKRVTDFNYTDYKSQSTTLNKGSATNQLSNRFGIVQDQNYEGVLKLAVGNSNQQKVPYIKQNGQTGVTKDVFIENYIPNRTAQMALANFTVLKIVIPGDPSITAGRVVEFNLYTLKPSSSSKDLDKFYSGKYLVSAVRHVLGSPNKYQTILEITKDSSQNDYIERDSDTAQANEYSGYTNYLNDGVN